MWNDAFKWSSQYLSTDPETRPKFKPLSKEDFEFLEKAFEYIGIAIEWRGENENEVGINKNTGNIIVKIDPIYYRPTEVNKLQGDPTKARKNLGWNIDNFNIDSLIKEMMASDLNLVTHQDVSL